MTERALKPCLHLLTPEAVLLKRPYNYFYTLVLVFRQPPLEMGLNTFLAAIRLASIRHGSPSIANGEHQRVSISFNDSRRTDSV
jgi:hypothetical protein